MKSSSNKVFKEFLNIKKYILKDKNPERLEVISKKEMVSSIIESTVYTVLILIIFYFLPFTKEKFLELNLHPLVIMVALISLRYGIYAGFASSFIAMTGYLAAYIFSGNDMILFFMKFQYNKFFIIFLFIAMILGKFQANRKSKEEESKRNIEKLEKKLDDENEKNAELLMINRNLKNQVIQNRGGIISFKNVQGKLKLLKTLEEIYTETLNMINQFVNFENASIYIKKGERLNQIIKIGNSALDKRLDINETSAQRFLKTYEKTETQEFPVDLKGKEPVFIAPVFYEKEIVAFIEITKLSYETSRSENYELFKIITDEINVSLQRVSAQNRKNNTDIFEKDTYINTNEYFEQVLNEIKNRQKYYNQSYLILEGKNKNNYSAAQLQRELNKFEKMGFYYDYVSIMDGRIKFLFINENKEEKKKQSEMIKSILKEEMLYEI